MSATLLNYLTEYQSFDDMNMFLESTTKDVTRAYMSYENEVRQANQKFFLEGVDEEPMLEAAENNFFAKIGAKVRELAEKIKKFFTDLLNKIKGVDINSDLAKAQKVMKEHPEYKDKILISIEKGDITLSDVARYEKEVETLIELIKKNQIDENSFKARFQKATEEFRNKGEVITKTALTAAGIIMIVPKVFSACGEAKKSMENFSRWCDKVKTDLERNNLNEPSKVRVILNTISNAMGVQTTEYKNRVSLLHRMSGALKKIGANKLADVVDAQDKKNMQKDVENLNKRRAAYDEKQKDIDSYLSNKPSVPEKLGELEKQRKQQQEEQERKEKEKRTSVVNHYHHNDNNGTANSNGKGKGGKGGK